MAGRRPSARLLGQFVDNRFQLAVHFRQLRMEDLFGREQRLHVGDEERQPRVVQRRQFLVQFGVENGERPLGLFQLFFGPADFHLLAFLRVLQRLETVPLSVVIHQLSASLFDLFLQFNSNEKKKRVTTICFIVFLDRYDSGAFFLIHSIQMTYPHFGKLSLVSVERDEHLVCHFVTQILPQHLNVLRLDRQQIVARPVRFVYFRHTFVQSFAGRLHCYLVGEKK